MGVYSHTSQAPWIYLDFWCPRCDFHQYLPSSPDSSRSNKATFGCQIELLSAWSGGLVGCKDTPDGGSIRTLITAAIRSSFYLQEKERKNHLIIIDLWWHLKHQIESTTASVLRVGVLAASRSISHWLRFGVQSSSQYMQQCMPSWEID